MADIPFVILLTIHIASVINWFGASLLFVSAIRPSLAKTRVETRSDFLMTMLPRFTRYLTASSLMTIGAGLLLFGYVGSVDESIMPRGWNLISLMTGAVFGLVALVVTLATMLPSSSRLLRMLKNVSENVGLARTSSAAGVSSAELQNIQRTIGAGSLTLVVILTIVLILMILGVYL